MSAKGKTIVALLLILSVMVQAKIKETISPAWIVYGTDKVDSTHVPPPAAFYHKSGKTANIVVNYNGFSEEAQVAVQYAIDIWASLLTSSQTIYIDAYWTSLESGVLGSCLSDNFYRNIEGLPGDDILYATPLAEKLTRSDINAAGDADMTIQISNKISWYYGTDGETPTTKYDLVSIVLHEICHGLGYTSDYYVYKSKGYFYYSYPYIFDTFLEYGDGYKLTSYESGSSSLMSVLTSDNLYINSPILNAKYGSRAKVYAPSTWNNGSSVSHLDDDTYSSTNNMLMCPYFGKGSSIHDPGVINLSIMEDIGWSYLFIEHEPLQKYIEQISDTAISVSFIADYNTEIVKPTLHYSIDGNDFKEIELKTDDASTLGNYSACIPLTAPSDVEYYITVYDSYGREFRLPTNTQNGNFDFTYDEDTIKPTVTHNYSSSVYSSNNFIQLAATISDNYDIDSVWIEYSIDNEPICTQSLAISDDNSYRFCIDISDYEIKENSTISYRIVAQDVSINKNTAAYPVQGYVTSQINIIEYILAYFNKFEENERHFTLYGFNIDTAANFTSGALQSEHPYEEAGENETINFIAELVFPIKIDEYDPYIRFNEIAIVEAGESKTKYGDENFFDYVIVEGSIDNGNTWQAFQDGWDCTAYRTWKSTFSYELDATPSLYKERSINMLSSGYFKTNDIVLIRFRLLSDPYEAGWGWAIDDLRIQCSSMPSNYGISLSSEDSELTQTTCIYPNPSIGGSISLMLPSSINNADLRIYNLNGQCMFEKKNVTNNEIIETLLSKGLYIASAKLPSGKTSYMKFSVK